MRKPWIMLVTLILTVALVSMASTWLFGLLMVAFVAAFFRLDPRTSAFSGFVAVFTVWAAYAIYLSARNEHLLADQMGDLFGGISPIMLGLVTGVIGGVAGALISWSSALISRAAKKEYLV